MRSGHATAIGRALLSIQPPPLATGLPNRSSSSLEFGLRALLDGLESFLAARARG